MFLFFSFPVLRQPVVSGEKQRVVTGGVGEWVIAVIVVGLASLIFVIAFGTTMVLSFSINKLYTSKY
jgi:hypothetical protein